MPNVLDVRPGELFYCPDCVAPYGTAGDRTHGCGCERSAGITTNPVPRDIPRPFELCHYCQARVIVCGSRWHTFPCDACRETFFAVNARLEAEGRPALPFGRHSIVNGRWRRPATFAGASIVEDWARGRLRQGWMLHSYLGGGADWVEFGAFLAAEHDPVLALDLLELAGLVDAASDDGLDALLRRINRELHDPGGPVSR